MRIQSNNASALIGRGNSGGIVLIEHTSFPFSCFCELNSEYDELVVYILKQWIVMKVHSDWLLKLGISFAIHFGATHVGFAPEK